MKVGCYREVARTGGVTVLGLSETELSLEDVLAERVLEPRFLGREEAALFGDLAAPASAPGGRVAPSPGDAFSREGWTP